MLPVISKPLAGLVSKKHLPAKPLNSQPPPKLEPIVGRPNYIKAIQADIHPPDHNLKTRAKDLLRGARDRTVQYGLPPTKLKNSWALDVLKKGYCQATGLPFKYVRGKRNIWSPTLDRIVPEKGYVEGNVRVVCHGYNNFKSNWHPNVFKLLLQQCLVAYGFSPEIRYEIPIHKIFANPEWDLYKTRLLYSQLRSRAKKLGKLNTISLDEFRHNLIGRCPVTDITFDLSGLLLVNNLSSDPKVNKYLGSGRKQWQPWAPSPHQIIPGGGYGYDNVCIVSWAYNLAKSNFSDKDFITLIGAMGKTHGLRPKRRDPSINPKFEFKHLPEPDRLSPEELEKAIEKAMERFAKVDFSEFENLLEPPPSAELRALSFDPSH